MTMGQQASPIFIHRGGRAARGDCKPLQYKLPVTLEDVVGRHLQRFAVREDPDLHWIRAAAQSH
jgi:hypothetical protein